MHDLLLEHQQELRPVHLVHYAADLGLDVDRFREDLRRHVCADRIADDIDSVGSSGVAGTPTFFINGRPQYGAYDIDTLFGDGEQCLDCPDFQPLPPTTPPTTGRPSEPRPQPTRGVPHDPDRHPRLHLWNRRSVPLSSPSRRAGAITGNLTVGRGRPGRAAPLGDVLAPQVEAILDVWYGFVGANPHLLAAFTRPDGHPTRGIWPPCGAGLAAGSGTPPVPRSTKHGWTTSTNRATPHPHGQEPHRRQAAEHIPLRYVLALLIPITTTVKPFLAEGGGTAEEVEAMHQGCVKAVLLQVILWSYPYVREGDF
jgi:hypothetical protein